MALPPSRVIGCDFSGTVANPNSSSFRKGDRIAGVIHGCKDKHTGAFAEFLVANPGMCFLVPEGVKLEEACTLGVGWVSATQALQQRLFEGIGEGGKGLGERDAVSDQTPIAETFVGQGKKEMGKLDSFCCFVRACIINKSVSGRLSCSSTAPPQTQACTPYNKPESSTPPPTSSR